ncbi:MAG: hypothetical protein KDC98_20260 [Planctomycetes bacterium]|nr:hypothetical protein [Planctomycetota bacterium]
MRLTHPLFLSSLAALVAGERALAQNDDCSGAIQIVQGTNGPYSNSGSTTSFSWPCAAGGNDVWFIYVAPGTGPLTIDTCGAGYDSALELFDGNLGCGGLVSLGCNDDSCGLQSSVSVANVNVGDTIYVRVGGYNSATGTFPLNVAGPTGSGLVATATPYGTGCVARSTSFYEQMSAANFDLNNTAMTLLPLSPGYIGLPIGAYVAPTAAAVPLTLPDDGEVTQPLTNTFNYDGGSTTSLTVCSNGFVSVASGNGSAYLPSISTMLNAPETAWWVWHDFNPTAGGQVLFEEVGPTVFITWDAVWDYGGTSTANASTFQFQFDTNAGGVVIAFQTMSALAGTTNTDFLVGYSPGGASPDPGSIDISARLPGTFQVEGADLAPLSLTSVGRPVGGTTISLSTTNIGATAPFGAIMLGLNDPATDLTGIGMATCTQYTDNLGALLFLPLGATSFLSPLTVPNALGIDLKVQSFVYDPASNLTTLGAIASNGVNLFIGNL